MKWTKEKAYKFGFLEGEDAFDNNSDDPMLYKYYVKGNTGEYVSELLESYKQFGDTIYYQIPAKLKDSEEGWYEWDDILNSFEEGFYNGFEEAAKKYFKGN